MKCDGVALNYLYIDILFYGFKIVFKKYVYFNKKSPFSQ